MKTSRCVRVGLRQLTAHLELFACPSIKSMSHTESTNVPGHHKQGRVFRYVGCRLRVPVGRSHVYSGYYAGSDARRSAVSHISAGYMLGWLKKEKVIDLDIVRFRR